MSLGLTLALDDVRHFVWMQDKVACHECHGHKSTLVDRALMQTMKAGKRAPAAAAAAALDPPAAAALAAAPDNHQRA